MSDSVVAGYETIAASLLFAVAATSFSQTNIALAGKTQYVAPEVFAKKVDRERAATV